MPSILIVEDEAKMRRLLELNLGEDGFTTLSAGDAETGLKLLRENPIDLVLTDLKLPGMNGLGISADHQASECGASGGGDDRIRQRGDRCGCDESGGERLRPETVFADGNADGNPQGIGRPQSEGRKPLTARGAGQALFASEYCRAQPEDAGSAGDRRTRCSDECDRACSAARAVWART